MSSGGTSKNQLERKYETKLGYLSYDSASDRISVPMRIRERHLTPDTTDISLQGVGPELQVTIWSERDSIVMRIPLKNWRDTPTYEGTLSGANGGLFSVGRFDEDILRDGDEVPVEVTVHGFDEP